MALLIQTTPGDTGFDMRTLNFDSLIEGKSVTAFNAFIIQWKPATGTNVVNVLGNALDPQVSGGVLQGLTGAQLTQIMVTADSHVLNMAGMSYSVADFVDLVQGKNWAGLAAYMRQGDDSIVGTKNDDTLLGGAGDDVFSSGAGDDIVNGGAGSDKLVALGGHDVMTGGRGADTFAFVEEPLAGQPDWVTITDFRHNVDQISVSDVAFNDVGFGGFDGAEMDISHFVRGRVATTEDHAIIYHRARGFLYYDRDGAGGEAQVLMAKLGAGTILTFDDMWVV